MELVEVTRALKARKFLAALVVVLAIGAGVAMKEKSHSVPTGSATSQVLIDSPQSALADLQQDTGPLAARAAVFAQLMTSGAVLQSIAHAAHVPANEVTAEGPYSGAGEALDVPTPSEARGAQLLASKLQYHMSFIAQQDLPVITVSVTGPTAETAGALANSVTPGVQSWLTTLENTNSLPAGKRVTIRQLGDAQAGTVNSSSGTTLAAVAFMAVLVLGWLALILLEGRRVRKQADRADDEPSPLMPPITTPVPASGGTDSDGFILPAPPSRPGFGTALRAARNGRGDDAPSRVHAAGFATPESKRQAQTR